jgi:hypothetical protein
MALLASCGDAEVVHDDPTISYDYALVLPLKFVQQTVSGIDSKVEEFRSADTIVSTDFGLYSGAPECSESDQSCKIHSEKIAGRKALVKLYKSPPDERSGESKLFNVFVHVSVNEHYGLALNVFARCDTKQACDDALRYIRQVRLLRTKSSTGKGTSSSSSIPGTAVTGLGANS